MKLPESSGGSFEKCPEGNHLAVCYEVIDLGTQTVTYKDETKRQRKIFIGWETPEELMEDGRPFVIGKRYTLSSHEMSTLRKHLESWRGKRFTDDELKAFDIANLIGVGCFLNVVHSERDGRTYANIEAVAKLPKGMSAPPLVNDTTYLSLEVDAFDKDAFNSLSDRMKETISDSPEYQRLLSGDRSGVTNTGTDPIEAMQEGGDESPF